MCVAVVADGLVGDFTEDYPVLCERGGLTALEVQVNAVRPGKFINLILKDDTDPSTLSEVQVARKWQCRIKGEIFRPRMEQHNSKEYNICAVTFQCVCDPSGAVAMCPSQS